MRAVAQSLRLPDRHQRSGIEKAKLRHSRSLLNGGHMHNYLLPQSRTLWPFIVALRLFAHSTQSALWACSSNLHQSKSDGKKRLYDGLLNILLGAC